MKIRYDDRERGRLNGWARVCGFRFEKGGMILETMIWVAVIVIAAILEGMSAQLISIWFVGGGIAGMIAQLCGAPVWLQVLIAAVVTLVPVSYTHLTLPTILLV